MILRLGAVLAVAVPVPEFARLLLLVALIRLRVTRLLLVPLIGLRLLCRNEARLLTEAREILALIVAVVLEHLLVARLRLRLVLAELLLGCRDQAEIVLGVLIVVLGGDGVARGACIARKLQIFLRDVRRGTADLDVGAVGFKHPGHRVLAAPVVIVVVIVPVAHPLVILTVSHVLPLFPALS